MKSKNNVFLSAFVAFCLVAVTVVPAFAGDEGEGFSYEGGNFSYPTYDSGTFSYPTYGSDSVSYPSYTGGDFLYPEYPTGEVNTPSYTGQDFSYLDYPGLNLLSYPEGDFEYPSYNDFNALSYPEGDYEYPQYGSLDNQYPDYSYTGGDFKYNTAANTELASGLNPGQYRYDDEGNGYRYFDDTGYGYRDSYYPSSYKSGYSPSYRSPSYKAPSYSTPKISTQIYYGGQPIYVPTPSRPTYTQTPTYTPVCSVNIYSQSQTVTKGSAVKLTWSSTNAVKVVLNGGSVYNKTVSSTGSYTVYPYTNTTYSVTCYSRNGQTNRASVSVNVYVPQPVYNYPSYTQPSYNNYAYSYTNYTNNNYGYVPYLGSDYPPAPKKVTYTAPKKTTTVKKTEVKKTGVCTCVDQVLFGIQNLSGGVQAGKQVHYGVGVKNVSENTLKNVILSVELPEGMSVSTSDVGGYIKGSRLFVYNIGDLKADEVKQFMLTVDTTSSLANGQTVLVNAYASITLNDETLTLSNRQKEVYAYSTSKIGANDSTVNVGNTTIISNNVNVKNDTVSTDTSGTSSSMFTLLTSGWVGWLLVVLGILVLFFVFRFILSILIPKE